MKKLFCILLSVIMTLSLGTVAFADELSLESMGVTYLVPDGKYVNDFSDDAAVSIADVEALVASADYEAVRDSGLTAVICMNEYQTEWAKAVVNGIKAVFEPLNIEVLTIMDAGFSAPQGAMDLEQAVEMKPDIILCYDQEPATLKDSTLKAAAQGTKVTFFACAAADCENNKDYYGVVSGDNYTMGYLSGKRIAEAIGGEGEVAVVPTNFMSNDMRTRYEGALAALGEYEGISLITDQASGFSTEECADLGEQIIMAHPDLKGYWGQWDELAVSAVSAMRSLGFEVVGSGPDLASSNTAANMAADGGFVGTGAFSAYSLGVGGGLCAVAAQAGKEIPDQVTIPIVEVTKDNILDTYFMLFHDDLPKQIVKMLSK
ncbi:MAG: substrate-binding domain-containing protein [Oscillospiraceae bacterium]|nr:substrate-binding domain-containing protein [Oscillospiraceae bacterium]